MFDFDAGKLVVIGVVALVVIGPKELPRVLRQVGQMVGKARRMAGEFQSQFMDAMREAELQDVKAEMEKVAQSAKVDVAFDPVRDVRREIGGALTGEAPAAASAGLAKPASHVHLDAADASAAPLTTSVVADAGPVASPTPDAASATAPGGEAAERPKAIHPA